MDNLLTIIIPALDEMKNPIFKNSILSFQELSQKYPIEVLCVISPSAVETIEFLKQFPIVKILVLETNSRSLKMKKGFEQAQASLILFNHPRSFITENGIKKLLDLNQKINWGGFYHKFDKDSIMLKFTSWYSNFVRAKIRSILYLDHCIFLRKDKLNNVMIFPDNEIFEDTIISQQLLNLFGPCYLISEYSTTSSIRFQKNGFFFQAILNQILKIAFYLKVNDKHLNKIYEKGIELNSKFR